MNEQAPVAQPEAAPAPRRVAIPLPVGVPAVTYTLLAITVGVYVLQVASVFFAPTPMPGLDWLELFGARINGAIRAGEIWRLLTPVFLHVSPGHIFFNMYSLLVLGSALERHYGHARFLALYVLGGYSGNVISFLLGSDNVPSEGASTAIFGLAAAEAVFLYENRAILGGRVRGAITNIIVVIGVNLLIGLTPGIDNWGHIGGLLGGLLFARMAGPRWTVEGISPDLQLVDLRESRQVVVGGATVLLIFGALATLGMLR